MHPFTIAMLITVGVFALIGAYKGARRGISRQVIRSITVIASVFISLFLTKLLSGTATVWLENRTGEEILAMLQSINIPIEQFEELVTNLDGDTLTRLMSIPLALVVMPVCFVICFLLVKLVMLIPHAILSGIFGFTHRKNNVLTRLLGMALGVVHGVIVAALIIAPMAGAIGEFTAVIEEMQEEAPEDQATIRFTAFYEENLKPAAEDTVIKTVAKYGGRDLYSKLATVKIGNTDYDMVATLKEPATEIAVGVNHLWGWDWKKPTPENEAAIEGIIDAICESEYTAHLVANLCAYVSHVYEDSSFTEGLEEPLSDVVEAAFNTIALIDQGSLEADLGSLTEAYFILARENVIYAMEFGDTDAITAALTKECTDENGNTTTIVKSLIDTLNSNEHTAPLVTTLAKISVSTMAQQLGMDENMHQLYEDVRAGLSDTLSISKENKTEEEYKAEVSTSLDTVLQNNGIELEAEIVDGMADFIYENYDELNKVDSDGDSQLSEQEINDVIFSYFDAYMEYMNTGEAPEDIPELPGDIEIPGDLELPGDIELP